MSNVNEDEGKDRIVMDKVIEQAWKDVAEIQAIQERLGIQTRWSVPSVEEYRKFAAHGVMVVAEWETDGKVYNVFLSKGVTDIPRTINLVHTHNVDVHWCQSHMSSFTLTLTSRTK